MLVSRQGNDSDDKQSKADELCPCYVHLHHLPSQGSNRPPFLAPHLSKTLYQERRKRTRVHITFLSCSSATLFQLVQRRVVIPADNGLISRHIAGNLIIPCGAGGISLVYRRNGLAGIQAAAGRQVIVGESP